MLKYRQIRVLTGLSSSIIFNLVIVPAVLIYQLKFLGGAK
jgi:hypothetical protein